ncbi:MAG: regulator of replication initiation timing [Halioglobus sp.]
MNIEKEIKRLLGSLNTLETEVHSFRKENTALKNENSSLLKK